MEHKAVLIELYGLDGNGSLFGFCRFAFRCRSSSIPPDPVGVQLRLDELQRQSQHREVVRHSDDRNLVRNEILALDEIQEGGDDRRQHLGLHLILLLDPALHHGYNGGKAREGITHVGDCAQQRFCIVKEFIKTRWVIDKVGRSGCKLMEDVFCVHSDGLLSVLHDVCL